MTLQRALDVIWRFKWITALVFLVTLVAVSFHILTMQDEYSGTAKLLVTAPERTTVDLYTTSRPSTVQDEINIARNNFVDVLKSDETRRRVIEALSLPEELHGYALHVSLSRETDFLTVEVVANEWAAKIANEHVIQAQRYFGEIRAQPTTAAKLALANELAQASTQQGMAEQTLVDFKNRYHISSIDADRDLRLTVLSRLYDQRYQAQVASSGANLSVAFPEIIRLMDDQRNAAILKNDPVRAGAWDEVIAFHTGQILKLTQDTETRPAEQLAALVRELGDQQLASLTAGKNAVAEAYAFVVAYYSGQMLSIQQANTSLDTINEQIAEQEAIIAQLNALTPQYNELQSNASLAQANYEKLFDAYQEATIREATALRADFIQVVLPATLTPEPNRGNIISLIVLALLASLGVGIALAFTADFLGRWLWPAAAEPSRRQALERR